MKISTMHNQNQKACSLLNPCYMKVLAAVQMWFSYSFIFQIFLAQNFLLLIMRWVLIIQEQVSEWGRDFRHSNGIRLRKSAALFLLAQAVSLSLENVVSSPALSHTPEVPLHWRQQQYPTKTNSSRWNSPQRGDSVLVGMVGSGSTNTPGSPSATSWLAAPLLSWLLARRPHKEPLALSQLH